MAVTYAPPGDLSTASYLHGTSLGSQVQIQETSSSGVAAQMTGPGVQVSASYQYGEINGQAFQMTSNGSWGVQVTSNTDLANHLNDKFWLWTNVGMDVTSQDTDFTVHIEPPPGQPVNVLEVTLAELVGLAPMPDYKARQLVNLTADDKAAILRADPFLASPSGAINAAPALDPKRFTFLTEHFQVTGPDYPGDPPSGFIFDTNSQTLHGVIRGYQHQVTGSLMVGVNVSFITEFSAMAGFQWQYQYQKTTQATDGTITDAQGLLESNTQCWHQGIDLYWDGAFGTYLFQPTDAGSGDCNEGPGSKGIVFDANGAPLPGAPVTGVLPNGTVWRTSTNAQGIFKFYHLPAGTKKFPLSGPPGSTVRIDVGPGKPADLESIGLGGARGAPELEILLDDLAPSAGAAVAVTSSSDLVLVPAQVNIPAGALGNDVTIAFTPGDQPVTITAHYRNIELTTRLLAGPNPPIALFVDGGAPTLQTNATGRILLGSRATADAQIRITTDAPSVLSVTSSVTIPVGDYTASFPIKERGDRPTRDANVTVQYQGASSTVLVYERPESCHGTQCE